MTIDYKLQHLHATADDRYKSNRAQVSYPPKFGH